jgi:predicted ribosomally synthesized peptide with SipW-like signal peptide
MKRRILLFFLSIAVIAMVGSGTLAYFTMEDTATNVVTSGGIDFKLQGKSGEEIPAEGIEIMPGDTVSDVARVINTGEHPMYLRVQMTPNVVDDATLDAGKCISIVLDDTEELKADTDKWTYEDGYYYYQDSLDPEETAELPYRINFDGKTMGNQYRGKKFSVTVTANAVQSENNGDSVWKAVGWKAD